MSRMGALAAQDSYDPSAFDVPGEQSTGVGWPNRVAKPIANVIEGLSRDIPRAASWFYGQASKPEAEAQADVRNVIGSVLHDTATLPRRAIESSQYALDTGNYDPKVPVEAVLTAAGTALPWAEKGAAGVFGGRLAKTADLGALAKAEEMAAKGSYADDIWTQTGWFQGADKKWRFEIPDTASKWKDAPQQFTNVSPSGIRPHSSTAKMGNVFEHPDLYAAYPQLHQADLNVGYLGQNMKGSYQSGSGVADPTITLSPAGPKVMRSTNLHELQHGIQDIEGFATGGNTFGLRPGTPAWDIYQERLKAIRTPTPKAELEKSGVLGPEYTYEEYLKQHKASLKDPKSAAMLDRAAQDHAVQEGYRRLAGETEARTVQQRADYPLDKLREVPPAYSQDVPNAQQIVKFRDPNAMGSLAEPQLSAKTGPLWSPLSREKLSKPLSEMEHRYTDIRQPEVKYVDPASMVGGHLILTPWDLSMGNKTLTHVDSTKLPHPVELRGGQSFPEANRGLAAASELPFARPLDNLAAEYADKGKVYIAPMTMGPQGIDASHHVADPQQERKD